VGGSFESRVWNGREFVGVHDIAYFNGETMIMSYDDCHQLAIGERASWLPLEGGQLGCDVAISPGCTPRSSVKLYLTCVCP
jgi:hypothetical protein